MMKDIKSLEEKKVGVKGLGRKKTDESEHFLWQDDIKVPCGRLVPWDSKDSVLEYNEYAVYGPKQVSILDRGLLQLSFQVVFLCFLLFRVSRRFLVAVKYEEKDSVTEPEDWRAAGSKAEETEYNVV